MSSDIPSDIQAFIIRHIGSVQQLKVLLAVTAEPMREWKVEDLSMQLKIGVSAVTNRLLALCIKGFVIQIKKGFAAFYRFSPNEKGIDQMVLRLKSAYDKDPEAISEIIYSRGEIRIQGFSDAFRLRDEDQNG